MSALRQPRLAGIVLLLAAALLYWLTLDNGLRPGELEGGDLITHQYAQVQARPSNAPGYPLYTMGGWLWFHGLKTGAGWLGISPNSTSLLSSYSTLWALLSLWLLYQILLHITRSPIRPQGDWPLAWLLTAFYAVTYFFWYYATTTEQYTSAIAHTLAILYVYLRWRDDSPRRSSTSYYTILFLAFLCGLSLAHMVTVALVVPPLLAAVLWQEPKLLRRPGLIGAAVLAAALPLVSYAYVYLRGAAHPEWWGTGEWASAGAWFWSFVSTAQGQDELSWGLVPGAAFFANGFPQLIWQELSVPVVVLGLLGLGALEKRLRLVVGGTLLLYGLLCWVDRFGNWFQVILPAYPLLIVGVAALIHRFDGRVIRTGRAARSSEEIDFSVRPRRQYDVRNTALALLLLLILWRGLASLPDADSRDRPGDTALERPTRLLDQPLPAGAALFAAKDDALGLSYLIEIAGQGSDAHLVDKFEASQRLAQGKSVLVTADAAHLLLGELSIAPASISGWSGAWVLLSASGAEQPRQPAVVLQQPVGDGIILEGYTYRWGGGLNLWLFWSVAEGASPADWSISVRSLDGSAQQDATGPVFGLRPFSLLAAGEVVIDAYSLPIPAQADAIRLILYRSRDGGFENLADETLRLDGGD
ncbi:MAG: DUF2723 domain-containing protein [Caldilineaceae bacterium]